MLSLLPPFELLVDRGPSPRGCTWADTCLSRVVGFFLIVSPFSSPLRFYPEAKVTLFSLFFPIDLPTFPAAQARLSSAHALFQKPLYLSFPFLSSDSAAGIAQTHRGSFFSFLSENPLPFFLQVTRIARFPCMLIVGHGPFSPHLPHFFFFSVFSSNFSPRIFQSHPFFLTGFPFFGHQRPKFPQAISFHYDFFFSPAFLCFDREF